MSYGQGASGRFPYPLFFFSSLNQNIVTNLTTYVGNGRLARIKMGARAGGGFLKLNSGFKVDKWMIPSNFPIVLEFLTMARWVIAKSESSISDNTAMGQLPFWRIAIRRTNKDLRCVEMTRATLFR